SLRHRFPASRDLVALALDKGWLETFEEERDRAQRKTFAVRLAASPPGGTHGPVPEPPRRLSPAAHALLEALEGQGPAEDHRVLLKSARASLATLRRLHKSGLVELSDAATGSSRSREAEEAAPPGKTQPDKAAWPDLTPRQAEVFDELARRLESGGFSVALLHGITASGKTEVYLRLIARCLERGRTALLLVPEIALTPAVESLFRARFGDRVAVLHSGLNENERHEAWWQTRRGEATVVLGTRSAVFAPLDGLGLVIVDEEHESSYKQEETPRYQARDVAVVRARLAKALAVLGSATPSLESYWNARQGKYHLATLQERIAGRPLASVEIIDMREEFRQTHTKVPMSRRLREEIESQLRARAQTMILLNRRGYSWFLLCRNCGQSVRCANCSVSLTYHRREHRLICHYCNYAAAVPARCPACGGEHLYYVGEGTERIEQKLAELFPGARVERLDRDAARRRGYFQSVLSEFRQGKIDILVGTQLIAKGHDFPGVTLVGVVSVDMGLARPDFRAAERTFQLLTQAAGRAGRGDTPGRVLVQTFFPEHYSIRLAAEQNYEAFFAKEMSFRRLMHYPPVTALANVIVQHAKLEQAARYATVVGRFFQTSLVAREKVKVSGPNPAPLARVEGRYRIQFLLKANSRAKLTEILRRLADEAERQGIPSPCVMIDMDPVSVM
ncbi:MAG TPA: primosomal protein N', partial [Terriglobia bacterium]|nr:primosomal protein N' [Terriglobia bacterium]